MSFRPHVVLVVLDTVRADGPGFGEAGPSAMPALQSFARSAAVYPDTYSVSPWTLPSHASLFTGAHVWRHGCHELHRHLDGTLPTLAELMSAGGYATGAVSANTWVGPDFGLDRGFERFVRAWRLVDRGGDIAGAHRSSRAAGRTDVSGMLRRARDGGFAPAVVNTAHQLVRRSRGQFGGERVERLATRTARDLSTGGRPVFLFVNFLDAHLRYWPPRRYRKAELGGKARLAGKVNQDPLAYIDGKAGMTDEDVEILRGLYRGELRRLDDVMERFLEHVDETLGLDDTVVIVTSDHGEHLGEHGLMDHRYSLSELLLKVPLLVRAPGGAAGVQPGIRQTIDILPTVLKTAGLPGPVGTGLGRPVDAGGRPWAMAEYLGPQPTLEAIAKRRDPEPFRRFDRALRALILADGRKLVAASDGSAALYDLAGDPGETTDLAIDRPGDVAELTRLLDDLEPGLPADLRGVPSGDAGDGDEALGPDVRRALESLGYLQ